MTKKHFVEMAAEFKVVLNELPGPEVQVALVARAAAIKMIEAFMRVAENVNSRFDRARFIAATGMND